MAILLAELVNLRFNAAESASGFCLRLRELFEDLEMVPGASAICMNDTQKIGYLLSGIRLEKPLQAVYVALQDKQMRGAITFDDACEDLHLRCEAIRADELLSTPVRGTRVLVTTQAKRQNKEGQEVERGPCLEKGCQDFVKIHLPLCPLHYHQCVSGKCTEVELKDGLGIAKFNATTQRIVYPSTVPKNRLPTPRVPVPGRKALMSFCSHDFPIVAGPLVHGAGEESGVLGQDASPVVPQLLGPLDSQLLSSASSHALKLECDRHQGGGIKADNFPPSTLAKFYFDSGAGQCLSACSSAFATMEPCHLQVIGVAGHLTIHGYGTAIFLVTVDGYEALLRIHNCLHSFGEFNLISVSQLNLVPGNNIDFSIVSPMVRFPSSQSQGGENLAIDLFEVPLEIDEGLYSISLEPITPNDPRFSTLPCYDVTPSGPFVPLSQMLCAIPGSRGQYIPTWTTAIISDAPKSGGSLQ